MSETPWQMLEYARRISADMEREAFALASALGEIDSPHEGRALNIGTHLGRVVDRLKSLLAAVEHMPARESEARDDG